MTAESDQGRGLSDEERYPIDPALVRAQAAQTAANVAAWEALAQDVGREQLRTPSCTEDGWMTTEVPCSDCAGGWHPARKCVEESCPCDGDGEPVGPHVAGRKRSRWLDRLWRRHPSCDFSMTRSQTDV